uniref:Uncharacterized protein n=1 Tax=Opuntia streptacantha TaxID=393608 RepID=A0A7C9ARJ6_OPUST
MTPKKKKKEPPDPFMPVTLLPSARCSSLTSRWLDSFGVELPCPVLDCYSSGRCAILVQTPWLLRNLTVSPLKSSIASVEDLISQLGFVGEALGSSIGAWTVARSAIDGGLVALRCQLKWTPYLFTVSQPSDWHLRPAFTSAIVSLIKGQTAKVRHTTEPSAHEPA